MIRLSSPGAFGPADVLTGQGVGHPAFRMRESIVVRLLPVSGHSLCDPERMASRRVLDAGAALGAAALVISGASLLAQHAPELDDVHKGAPGQPVAGELRRAELAAGTLVILAGGVASVAMREAWPLLLSFAAIGSAVAVYEVTLRARPSR